MKDRGQALVLFALFLLVLLGISALAVDYANWLLIDRRMQNVSDHASLAGASVFKQTISGTNCKEDPDNFNCQVAARTLAWTSLNDELDLGIANIAALAAADSPGAGNVVGTRTIWVSVPPPATTPGHNEYHQVGGRLALQQGVVFVRVDEPTRAFFAGALGIQPGPRTGWATAGILPNDFALEIFCRDGTNPNGSGASCVSKGVGIEGQGGITLIRGDIGSNQSLQVTANTGQGVVLQDGNVFIANVADSCGASTWNCPPATLGGITDGLGNPKDAFYIPPNPYLRFASPLDNVTVTDRNCTGASAPSDLCVPFAGDSNHDWSCNVTGFSNLCGVPAVSSGSITCNAAEPPAGFGPSPHLLPFSDGSGASAFDESPNQPNGDDWKVLDDDPLTSDPDTTGASNPPADYIYMSGVLGTSGGGATQRVTYNLRPPFGIPRFGSTTVRYVAFKTNGSALTDTGNVVSVQAKLMQNGTAIGGSGSEAPDAHPLTGTPTVYSFTVTSGITDYTSLSIEFTFHHMSGDNSNRRGGGIAFAEAETPELDPALPALVPPGYYHSITVPSGGCAIMDPTGVYSGLKDYQKPGIYRFGTGNNASINIGDGAYLIGDGVTLVFNPEFPDPTGGRGIVIGANGALVMNTSRKIGLPACSADTETIDYNPSAPLSDLPSASLCAAWAVDVTDSASIKPGVMNWVSSDGTISTRGYCDPAVIAAGASPSQCVRRADYSPLSAHRGVTFYFSVASWPPSNIDDRFQISGSSGSDPGIAFRGILYAPWDDVKLTGSNDFNDVGQVFAWTAKFAGQATIFLDYPYTRCEGEDACLPYLIEPTLNQ
jgi:hypothetical protein